MIIPGMNRSFGFLLTETMENDKLLKLTKAGTVHIIHSSEDTRIPFNHANILFKAAGTKSELITIKGDHSDPIYDENVIRRVSELINVDDIEGLTDVFIYMKRRYIGIAPFFDAV